MARITRKELKTDKFAMEVEQTVDFFDEHRKEIVRYGSVAVVVILIAVAFLYYRKQQHATREEALAQAIEVQEAPVGPAAPGSMSFPTQPAKDQAAVKVFGDLASKYSGSDEAAVAEYYLGCIASDQGKLSDAARHFKAVADSGNQQYSSMAKLSLAQVYFLDGHAAQGEQILRDLMAHPTMFVSKEQAALALGRELAKTNPDEARKLVGPLRTSRSAVSTAALELYSELLQK